MRRRNELKYQILSVMREIPETRNNDITLMHEVWKKYFPTRVKKTGDGEFGIYFKDMYFVPREDNVKRIRCVIQNDEGLLLPTNEEVRKQRKISEDEWKEYITRNSEHLRL